MIWPENKDFAFTIVDDTDHVNSINKIKAVYDLLDKLQMKTTKTVWVLNAEPGTAYFSNLTLENKQYLDYILFLKSKGFEIGLHGVRSCTSNRELIIEGFEKFKTMLGEYPILHVNHAKNLDNLYWGLERIPGWKKSIKKYQDQGTGYGHRRDMPYYWGDLSKSNIRFVRGLIVNNINTLKVDPFMPYHIKRFPECNQWFSGSDGHNEATFNKLISYENIDRLEREKGLCIAYTHFGGDFVNEDSLSDETEKLLTYLAGRNGWFVPVGEILNYLSKGKQRTINIFQDLILGRNIRQDIKMNKLKSL